METDAAAALFETHGGVVITDQDNEIIANKFNAECNQNYVIVGDDASNLSRTEKRQLEGFYHENVKEFVIAKYKCIYIYTLTQGADA